MSRPAIITIWKDHQAASLAAAYQVLQICREAISTHDYFTLALSGGTTPRLLYQMLAAPDFRDNIPWNKVYLFWSDERFVPADHPESNYKMVHDNLIAQIPIPAHHVFPVPTNGKPGKAAGAYEKKIRSFFGKKKPAFDCVLLGLGSDGHTASLFPGTEILREKKKLIREVWVEEKKNWRISFTYPLLNKASHLIFLVTGKDKHPAFTTLQQQVGKSLPAARVNPKKGTIYWIVDRETAGSEILLPGNK